MKRALLEPLLHCGFLAPAGITYQLETGKDGNTLHGGGIGYNKREWELVAVSPGKGGGTNDSWAVLSLESPDGDQVGVRPNSAASKRVVFCVASARADCKLPGAARMMHVCRAMPRRRPGVLPCRISRATCRWRSCTRSPMQTSSSLVGAGREERDLWAGTLPGGAVHMQHQQPHPQHL